MVKAFTAEEILIEDLFKQVPEEKRCPNIRKDDNGPYCAKNLKEGAEITYERRIVCDTSSLQLWCLDKDRYQGCIFFRGESLH